MKNRNILYVALALSAAAFFRVDIVQAFGAIGFTAAYIEFVVYVAKRCFPALRFLHKKAHHARQKSDGKGSRLSR